MPEGDNQFVFMTCRPGAENALKREIARTEPEWRLAFSRPGFLTFKLPAERHFDDQQLAERHWIFAHCHGFSAGKVIGPQLSELASQVWALDIIQSYARSNTFADVHVWQSAMIVDADLEQIPGSGDSPLCDEIDRAVRVSAPQSSEKLHRSASSNRRPSPRGGLVLDVIVLEPGQWWIGCHRAVSWPARWPGGAIPVRLPAHAVSRAYVKIEEAIGWSGLPLAAGDECVEIGCAPGGASQALLDRGLFVTGIDPADVDPEVLSHPKFRHLKKRGKDVRRSEFVGVRWLVADMNIAPEATLEEVEPIVMHPGVTIRGMILTFKLSDWSKAEAIPALTQRVHDWGYRDVRVQQLVSGGQEVCLVALRRKALRRLGRRPNRKRRPRTSKQPDSLPTQAPPASHSDLQAR
jgi:23S rRNA (cytidine2498-2'-O)-methyltransferase